MGKRKKLVRSHVRRASRLVLEKFYATEGSRPNQETLNEMVDTIERRVTPAIMEAVAGSPKP